MSVSDPLLKDIKVCTQSFLEEIQHSQYVSETNPNLIQFCQTLEKIFTTGLRMCPTTLGFMKTIDAWTLLSKIRKNKSEIISYAFRSSVDNVKQHKNVLTNTGRLRLLIRYCLVSKCLDVPVEFLVQTFEKCATYSQASILGDEILLQIFLSVLRQCSKITFKLDVKNASFLDISWKVPEKISLELVPTESLGISVSFASEKAIIVNMRSDSILAESGKVTVGDVLDELNGVHICSSAKGSLQSILKINKCKPVSVSIVKAIYGDSKLLYSPLISLLKRVHIDPDSLRNKYIDAAEEKAGTPKYKMSAGHKATYIGWVEIGMKGDVKQINKAAMLLVSPFPKQSHSECSHKRINKEINFEIGELGVKVVDSQNTEVLVKHSYMEISSCGSVSFLHNHFAYVAGDEYCNVANKFTCYIFKASNSVCYTILQSIGQGFQRTHFAV